MEDFRRSAQDASRSATIRQNYAVEAEAIAEVVNDSDGTYLVLPTEILKDRILIPDPKAPVEVMYLGRANTDGDVMVWMPKQRVLIRANMDFREQERRFVGDDEWRLRAFRQYWEQIADCAYRELKGQPIDLSTSCAPLKPT